ncbi:Glycosyl transferase family 2 [Verrucomicrobium sp. GAS474]|uniref:glycosyltransferase family 2 protein n=1 Tax=Verrucomicrobium sp. GAS474 TaxID=1882831 RepID=UPI00087DB0E1|nr:glycosyltransferase [Verrucomicrobium sp. GAS474]SDU10509.1 Glycosyl transferase family 2 [Verrucomicrobium sp. GAS474]
MRVTIAIPTYNRSRWLAETLASLAAHRHSLAADQLEVLVVDNASTDATAEIVRPHLDRPGWRYLVETEQGLNHARNRAVREARGEILVFLDDDVLLHRGWLDALLSPWDRPSEGGEAIGAVGGEVIPVFPEGCPFWLEGWATPLAHRADPGPLTPRQMPMGANVAFRKSVFDRFGLFRPELDRNGKNALSGGETEMLKRLHRGDSQGSLAVWFVPAAAVDHQFPASRMNLGYVCRHGYDSSRSRVLESLADPERSRGAKLAYGLSRLLLHLPRGLLLLLAALFLNGLNRTDTARKTLLRAARSGGYVAQIVRSLPRLLLPS